MKYDGVTKGPNSERLQKLVSEIEKQVNEDKELQKKVDNFNRDFQKRILIELNNAAPEEAGQIVLKLTAENEYYTDVIYKTIIAPWDERFNVEINFFKQTFKLKSLGIVGKREKKFVCIDDEDIDEEEFEKLCSFSSISSGVLRESGDPIYFGNDGVEYPYNYILSDVTLFKYLTPNGTVHWHCPIMTSDILNLAATDTFKILGIYTCKVCIAGPYNRKIIYATSSNIMGYINVNGHEKLYKYYHYSAEEARYYKQLLSAYRV